MIRFILNLIRRLFKSQMQDGNAILEPIVFEDRMLVVPKNKPVLQEFLHYHPMNGIVFEEVDNEKMHNNNDSPLKDENGNNLFNN